ncbi:MAG: hypothetical protein ACR2PH_11620 [Desulfobulbia bacterium]
MGYYSDFKIKVDGEVVCHCGKNGGFDPILYRASGYNFENGELSESKWYSYHENMIEVSKDNPDRLFQLDRDGEEKGDIERRYYKNGKYQEVKVEVVYEDFDESKMG